MRIVIGVEVDGRVTTMSLPASVPVAHLLPDLVSLVSPADTSRRPRTLSGDWLDLERSLLDQGCGSGSLISLEEKQEQSWGASHDPVAELVVRGPPVDLLPIRSSAAAIAGLCGAWIGVHSRPGAVVAVVAAPIAWASLPLLGGALAGLTLGTLRAVLRTTAACAGAAALGASGPLAATGASGLLLDVCTASGVIAHGVRSAARNPFARLSARALECSCFAAVIPLGLVAADWVGW
ncbi:MAG: EsaB/YukD family protein [Bacillota bacterium]